MGFKVWCDLTKLIGGETFWDKAEDAIRNSTAKFLCVLARTSNGKDGVPRELQSAQALEGPIAGEFRGAASDRRSAFRRHNH